MSQYYFLVASLPLLSYDETDAADPTEFFEMLAGHLSERDLAAVAAASIHAADDRSNPEATVPGPPRVPTLEAWNAWERGLRNALVRLRAAARSTDPAEYLRADEAGSEGSDDLAIEEAAREASSHDSPLSGEDILNRARWAELDELEVGHYFDLERIVIYFLKLQILARRRLFNRQDGEERFEAITNAILNDYYQEQSE